MKTKPATARRIDNGQRFLPVTPAQCATVLLGDPEEPYKLCPEPVAWFFHVPPGVVGYCLGCKAKADDFHERFPDWRDALRCRRAWWVKVA